MATLVGTEFQQDTREGWASISDFADRFRNRLRIITRTRDVQELDLADDMPAVDAIQTTVSLAPQDFLAAVTGVTGVKAVLAKITDDTTYIWTAIFPLNEDIASPIYDAEALLYTKYPRARFDFYVFAMPESGRVDDVMPSGFELLYSSDGSAE